MKKLWKRLGACLLIAALLAALLPVAFAAQEGSAAPQAMSRKDYDAADAVFDRLDAAAQEDVSLTALMDRLMDMDGVVPSSVRMTGENRITWQTTEGVTCAYSVRIQNILDHAVAPEGDFGPDIQTVSYAAKGGKHGQDVYLIEPYYGLDSSFTTQYQTEAKGIAEALGGTYYLYKKEAATIDAVADAVASGGIVIFDSHGSTDYEGANEDYTSGATTSYLCLQTGEGLTDQDYQGGHAVYAGASYNDMRIYEVDGTAIANHMKTTANNGLLWMAICLGMATDGLEAPLREKGVGVVYGYSQSVSFVGDYCFEDVFFNNLLKGKTVAQSVAAMKSRYGYWDYSPAICAAGGFDVDRFGAADYYTALRNKCAFPIVVSDEDTYPGHGKVDDLQTVNSTWSAFDQFQVTLNTDAVGGTASMRGLIITASPAEGYFTDGATVSPEGAASIEQKGDILRVHSVKEDCTVTVHFSAKTPAVLHFSTPDGVSAADVSAYVGDEVVLPVPEGTPKADGRDYVFVGWTEQPHAPSQETGAFYRVGEPITVAGAETTLYAMYQYLSDSKGGTPVFRRVEGSLSDWSGCYVLTGGEYALLANGTASGSALGSSDAAISFKDAGLSVQGDTLGGVSGEFVVRAEAMSGRAGRYGLRLYAAFSPLYLACRSNSDQLNSAENPSSNFAQWTLAGEKGHVTVQNVRYSDRRLQFCESGKYFRCVKTDETPLTLYRSEDCAIWYTTELTHVHTYLNGVCTACGDTRTDGYFRDVKPGRYFYDAVEWAVERGITKGTSALDFSPNLNCTRGQVVTFLWRAADCPEPESSATHFQDVRSGAFYEKAVLWAVEKGITKGTSATTFSPEKKVTRGETVTFLWRAAGCPEPKESAPFTDLRQGAFYEKAVAWAAENNVVAGQTATTFAPEVLCSRGMVVTFLYRLFH